MASTAEAKRPWGLKWRSSVWFVTLVIGLGIAVDLLVYSIIIPVTPFHLESLGYSGVSGLVGWLLFAYSAGLVLPTPLIAAFSERYGARKYPLLVGQLFLAGSQVMFMEAPKYWLMLLARIIQGVSSSIIWVIGLALLCETVPEAIVGKQLGLAITGLSIGFLVGPPVGGALYNAFGFRAPFIFGIIFTAIDFFGRLLIIERKDAIKYGIDPSRALEREQKPSLNEEPKQPHETVAAVPDTSISEEQPSAAQETAQPASTSQTHVSMLKIILILLRSPRAMVIVFISLMQGLAYSSTEPTLPLHLQDIWQLASGKVGLIYMAVVLPSLISSPLAGYLSDRGGAEWVLMSCLILSIPWWVVLTIQKSLALFIVAIAVQSFFTTAVLSPVTAELAAVSRSHAGIGYAHVYGAFNFCYGIGAGLGPVIGGQIYDHVKRGWLVVCLLAVGLFLLGSALTFCFVGNTPALSRLVRRYREGRLFKFRHSMTTRSPTRANERVEQ